MASGMRTQYGSAGGVEIASQVLSEESVDLRLHREWTAIPIDCMDEEPSMARFQRRAASFGEILVSSTVKDLVVFLGMDFAQCGEHELNGVPGTWRLFAVGD